MFSVKKAEGESFVVCGCFFRCVGGGGGSFLSDSNNIDDTYPLISSSNSEVVVECRLMV